MKAKKHLSFTPLREMISHQIRSWPDPRRQQSVDHSVHDAVMSGLACMYFQEPSLLQFQREMQERTHQNNLTTLFGVQTIPSSNTIKDVADDKDSRLLIPSSVTLSSAFNGAVNSISSSFIVDGPCAQLMGPNTTARILYAASSA